MQNILTTTTKVRETAAAVNAQDAQTEIGSGGALKVLCTPKFQCVTDNLCICAGAVPCEVQYSAIFDIQ